MEFRILGPLEVRHAGAAVPIPGRNQPRVLATLLLNAGAVVPVSRLVDALWPEAPPSTARRQVQNTVAALRRLLAGAGADPVTSRGDGYRLDAADLDSRRFAELVAGARDLAAAGRPEAAVAGFRSALALWRGPALDGLTGPALESAARRLGEDRLSALEGLFDAALDGGQHRELVAELRGVLAEHPHRQRFTGQLMTALHRAGRAREALDAFEDLSSRLAEDLGLDPDPALQALRRRIGDDPAARPAPSPAQLPPAVGSFTGRAAELARLDALLDSPRPAPIAALTGVGGAGKTALAIHWGTKHRKEFPGGQLYVNLRGFDATGPVRPADALRGFVRAIGFDGAMPSTTEELGALFRRLLAGRRALIILDNARDAEQALPLLPADGCVTLVTSRQRMPELAPEPIELGTLSRSDSVALLSNMVGRARFDADAAESNRLAELCGRLPLALRLAGANLACRPDVSVAATVRELGEASDRLSLLAAEGDADAAVTAVFERSFLTLDADARDLFCRLGFLPAADFTEDLAVAIGGADGATVRDRLHRLASGNLIEDHGGRYRFHDLMRLYAHDRQAAELDDVARDAIVDAVIAWQCSALRPEEFDNIVDCCRRWSTRPGMWRLAIWLRRSTYHVDRIPTIMDVGRFMLEGCEAGGDEAGRAAMHQLLAIAHFTAGDHDAGLHHARLSVRAVHLDETIDADGAIRDTLASLLGVVGEFSEAERLSIELIEIARRRGNTVHERNRLINLGILYRQRGRYTAAERRLRDARAIEVADGSASGESFLRLAIGDLYLEMGRLRDARLWLDRALADADSQPRLSIIESVAHGLRGEVHRLGGDYTAAQQDLSHAIDIADRSGRLAIAREARCSLAELHADMGERHRGLALAEGVLSEVGAEANSDLHAKAALTAGRIAVRLDRFREAIEHAHTALAFFSPTSRPLYCVRALRVLARSHALLGESEASVDFERRADRLIAELGVTEEPGVRRPRRDPIG